MELKELYQEIILDHGKSPRNKGKCKDFNREAKGHNPLCGDKVQIFLKLNEEQTVEDVSFEGEGCAISLASASILTETIKGKKFNIAKKIISDFLNVIKNDAMITINSLSDDQKTTIMSLSGVKKFPMRVKCATMAWHTLTSALES
jgi:nitrogen fixation NifU-like protein|tara:strand:+ start:495 stop:932 length:438 start_codon:yes stop_codon:yes gene_type:complete